MGCEKRAALRSVLTGKGEYVVLGRERGAQGTLYIALALVPLCYLIAVRKLIVLFLEELFVHDHRFAIYDAPNKAPFEWSRSLSFSRFPPMDFEVSRQRKNKVTPRVLDLEMLVDSHVDLRKAALILTSRNLRGIQSQVLCKN